jgi:hypothetical protein
VAARSLLELLALAAQAVVALDQQPLAQPLEPLTLAEAEVEVGQMAQIQQAEQAAQVS